MYVFKKSECLTRRSNYLYNNLRKAAERKREAANAHRVVFGAYRDESGRLHTFFNVFFSELGFNTWCSYVKPEWIYAV